MNDPISAIGEAAVFAGCAKAEKDHLRTLATPLRVQAGETIVDQGDFGETFGVLLAGKASVWRDGEQLAELAPGDCYGEMALLQGAAGGERNASVRADTECRCDTVSTHELNGALDELPGVAAALRSLAARRET